MQQGGKAGVVKSMQFIKNYIMSVFSPCLPARQSVCVGQVYNQRLVGTSVKEASAQVRKGVRATKCVRTSSIFSLCVCVCVCVQRPFCFLPPAPRVCRVMQVLD